MGIALLAAFYATYGSAAWITSLHERRWRVDLAFEAGIPFVPAAAIVYLSFGLVVLTTPWVLTTWRATVPLALTMLAEIVVGSVLFVVFPVANGFPDRIADGSFVGFFHLADALNLDTNEVPSLHVALTTTTALAFGLGRQLWVRVAWLLWALAVAGSTLLMHEHHLVDILGGFVLAAAGMSIVHRPLSTRSGLEGLYVDWVCLQEFTLFARRHVRYVVLFVVMLRASLPRWGRTRILRSAYCLAQHVDDVFDGDRHVENPVEHVNHLVRVMHGQVREGQGIGALAHHVAHELDRLATADFRPKSVLLEMFEVLERDRARLDGRHVWTAAQLAAHHRRTFRPSVDLMLVLLGSRLRAADVEPLVDALSWCSPHRDLLEDLEKGLINIPAEVMDLIARGRPEAFGEWLRDEMQRGRAAIDASRRTLRAVDRRDPGRAALKLFTSAIERYAKRYERSHRDLLAGVAPLPTAVSALSVSGAATRQAVR